MKKIYASMILVTVTVAWGGGFTATDGAPDALSPFYIMMIRFVGTTVFPLLICQKELRRLDHATIEHGIVTGMFLFLASVLQTFGLKCSTPSKNVLLTATNVVFVPYLLWLFRHRRPSRRKLIASLLCAVDIVLLMLKKDTLMLSLGDMSSLICALFFVLHIIALEHCSIHVDTMYMTALRMTTVGVISMTCALTLEQPPISFNWHAAGDVAYLILVLTLLVYLLQTFAQKFTTVNSASLILLMEALFVSIFSFLLLGEVMNPPMILGACLTFSSILYVGYKPGRKEEGKQQDTC